MCNKIEHPDVTKEVLEALEHMAKAAQLAFDGGHTDLARAINRKKKELAECLIEMRF